MAKQFWSKRMLTYKYDLYMVYFYKKLLKSAEFTFHYLFYFCEDNTLLFVILKCK